MNAELERIIAENAAAIGEEPTIGVHYFRDGRVRIYDLDRGYLRRPYRDYVNVERALWAARIAATRAATAKRLMSSGMDVVQAVNVAVREVQP